MIFPGPFAYVGKPAAMLDDVTQPGTASSASGVKNGLAQNSGQPPLPESNRGQGHGESVPAPGRSTVAATGTGTASPAVDDDNPHKFPPLILAASKSRLKEVKLLLQDPAQDVNEREPKSDLTALIAASGQNKRDVMACLLEAGATVNLAYGKQRQTALMRAALRRDVEVVKTLLSCRDIALDQTDASGQSALVIAADFDAPDVAACLLAAGADVNLAFGEYRQTALMTAALHGNVEVVKVLLNCKGIAVDATGINGWTSLLMAAHNNKPGIVACLLAAGANVNLAFGEKRQTALMAAAIYGYAEVVKTLLTCKDIVVNATNTTGRSALFIASLNNKPDIAASLLAAGANVNLVCDSKQRATALIAAAYLGHVEVVKTLLTCKDIAVDETDADDHSALFSAVLKNKPDVVACLLAAGANVNLVCGRKQATPLMAAAHHGHVEVVKTLLTCKDIALTRTDANKRSALFLAAYSNKPEVVALLLAAGASVKIADSLGETATTIAISKKHAAVLELLVQHGAVLPSFQAINLAQSPSDIAFAVSGADFDPDQKFTIDAQENPLGLAGPHSLDDPVAFIDKLLSVLESRQEMQQWLRAKGFRMACVLPVVECLSMLAARPILVKNEEAFDTRKERLVCAAALSRLSVLTAEGKAVAHYTLAGFSAANVERLSAVAAQQIEKLIAVSEQMLTTMGGDMLEKLLPDCLAATSLARQIDVEKLSANLLGAGWLKPLAQAIVTSWKAALATLESEPLAIPAGSTIRQITQSVFKNAERKAPQMFGQAMQRELAAPTLLAALRTWIGDAQSVEGLDLLFQIQCDQLRQYCEQIRPLD